MSTDSVFATPVLSLQQHRTLYWPIFHRGSSVRSKYATFGPHYRVTAFSVGARMLPWNRMLEQMTASVHGVPFSERRGDIR